MTKLFKLTRIWLICMAACGIESPSENSDVGAATSNLTSTSPIWKTLKTYALRSDEKAVLDLTVATAGNGTDKFAVSWLTDRSPGTEIETNLRVDISSGGATSSTGPVRATTSFDGFSRNFASNRRLAIGFAGTTPVLAYAQKTSTTSAAVRFRYLPTGTTTLSTPSTPVSWGNSAFPRDLSLAMTRDGSAIRLLVASGAYADTKQLRCTTSCSNLVNLSNGMTGLQAIDLDSSGNLHALWSDYYAFSYSAMMRYSKVAKGASAVSVSEIPAGLAYGALDATPDGTKVMASDSNFGSVYAVKPASAQASLLAQSDNASTQFGSAVVLTDAGLPRVFYPKDGKGYLFVATSETSASTIEVPGSTGLNVEKLAMAYTSNGNYILSFVNEAVVPKQVVILRLTLN